MNAAPRRRSQSPWFGKTPIVLGIVAPLALLTGWRLALDPHRPSGSNKVDPATKRFIDVEGAVAPLYLYGRASRDGILVVGDSRIGSDISIRELDERGLGPTGCLWNGLAQLDHVIRGVRMLSPRRVVVSLTPASVWLPPMKNMAALVAKERSMRISQRIDERLDDEVDVWRQRTFYTWEPNPWGGDEDDVVLDPRRHEGIYQGLLAGKSRERRLERLPAIQAELEALKRDGWNVACVRLPVSEGLKRIEDEAFDREHFTRICKDAGIPYLDFTETDYATGDGSHLLGADAERCTAKIAEWLSTLPGMSGR